MIQDIHHLISRLVASSAFAQVFPFLVLILVPTLVLFLNLHRYTLLRPFSMVLEIISAALPWNWSNGHSSPKYASDKHRSKPGRKLVRTRAEQLQANGDASGSAKEEYEEDGYYPGIVNISGTYCFMDSTLQAMASLSYLQPHIDEIHARAEELDVPTPVVDALRDILHLLNTPNSSRRAIRPVEMINALAQHSEGKNNALFSSREHQDAQELFQLISEAIKSEAIAVTKEGARDRGLGGLAPSPRDGSSSKSSSTISPHTGTKDSDINRGVFDGLTANRRSCMECGYTEAVMHFAFDNWQLSVPRQAVCRLEDCLKDYTRLEILTDCICRKCSMVATLAHLQAESDRLTEASNGDADVSSSKKKRAREARKLVQRVKAALDEGRIEEDIKGVKMEKVFSKASTKQAMVARPPPVLALHLNRSMHFGHYATKNNCRVLFPEVLDLTPYTTSGKLSTSPESPISQPHMLPLNRSTTPTPSTYSNPRTLYRLSAVVVHYGQHSFGHYVCYRRKPRSPSQGSKRFAPAKMQCPLGCQCKQCELYGPIREDDDTPSPGSLVGRGEGWLRISDDDVRECGLESVTQEGSGAFMLYYERVSVFEHEAVYKNGLTEAKASEETLKAPCAHAASGSTVSLALSVIEAAAKAEEERERERRQRALNGTNSSSSPPRVIESRIVRSVSAISSSPSHRLLSKSPPTAPLPPSSETSSTISEAPSSEKVPSLTNGIANGHIPHTAPDEDVNRGSTAADDLHVPTESLDSPSDPPVSGPIPIPIPQADSTPVRRSSPSPTRSHYRSLSPPRTTVKADQPQSPPSESSHPRLTSSQSINDAVNRSMSPARTVGLLA